MSNGTTHALATDNSDVGAFKADGSFRLRLSCPLFLIVILAVILLGGSGFYWFRRS